MEGEEKEWTVTLRHQAEPRGNGSNTGRAPGGRQRWFKIAPFAWSVVLVELQWTILWWSHVTDGGDDGLEHWSEVRAEGIDLGILHSEARRERAHPGRQRKERNRESQGGA